MSELRACEGGETITVRTTEWMEQCRACGTMVRADLVDHLFFGFRVMRARCHTVPRESDGTQVEGDSQHGYENR
jgi:hypothetical protein